MRRALHVLAVLVVGAVSTASAQARVRSNVRLMAQASGPPSVVVGVRNLLDDPIWLDALNSAYAIRLHWRVQLWRKRFLFDAASTTVEWDDDIQLVPVLNDFTFTERTRGRTTTSKFGTLDSLKQQVGLEVQLPTPAGLAPGRWYYALDVTISAGTDSRGASDAGGVSELVQRLILGSGPRQTLSQTISAPFVVAPR